MRVVIDGLQEDVPDTATISEVLRLRGEPTEHVIIELNGSFVRRENYHKITLKPGDRVEVVYPAFGG